MTIILEDSLVDVEALAKIKDRPGTAIIDATWEFPSSEKKGIDVFESGHIPGARHFDIDQIADTSADLPHMVPDAQKFQNDVRKLGININDAIIVYDATGIALAAARVWWMFRLFGHRNVSVLSGGLPAWRMAGHKVESAPPPSVEAGNFEAKFHPEFIRNWQQVLDNIKTKKETLVDARDAGRFNGDADEPWPGRPAMHIPGSLNLPFMKLMREDGRSLLPKNQLRATLESVGLSENDDIICSCGSGVTACVIALAIDQAGWKDAAVYDGSWAEWGLRDDLPKE